MTVDAILSRLEGVRRSGTGRWRAKCPAHGGKNGYALSIKEADDGTVLLHCFVCEGGAGEIASAIGVDLAEFFPPKLDPFKTGKPIRKPHKPSEVMAALTNDLRVAYVLFGDIAHGREMRWSKDKAAAAQKRVSRLLSELDMSA